jgi:hypothetical protein
LLGSSTSVMENVQRTFQLPSLRILYIQAVKIFFIVTDPRGCGNVSVTIYFIFTDGMMADWYLSEMYPEYDRGVHGYENTISRNSWKPISQSLSMLKRMGLDKDLKTSLGFFLNIRAAK